MTAAVFPLRPNCSGVLAGRRDFSGCPSQTETAVALAAEAKAVQDEWILPLITVTHTPRGKTLLIRDAIVIRNESGWVLDRLITRIVWE